MLVGDQQLKAEDTDQRSEWLSELENYTDLEVQQCRAVPTMRYGVTKIHNLDFHK